VSDLVARGYAAHYFFGDSASVVTRHHVETRGPFDCVLIDGDHRYAAVKRDFETYRFMARKLIAFHDIAGDGQTTSDGSMPVEVPILWRELKEQFRTVEYIAEGSAMGIGMILL
jgi:hypothetical protein